MRLLLIIILFFSVSVFSQSDDFQIWSTIKLDYNLNKKSNINFKQSLRTFQNSKFWKTNLSEIGYDFKATKTINFGIAYRYSIKNEFDNKINTNRLMSDITYLKKIKSFKIKYRIRLQLEKNIGSNLPIEYTLRNNIEISKKINNDFSSYIAGELFTNIPTYIYNKYRLTAGIDTKINSRNIISIFYRFQTELDYLGNAYILGLTYKHSLK